MRVQLIPLDGGDPIELAKDLTLFGRTADCDVRFTHKSISKVHCVLAAADGLVLVRDLGSTNGTRVNGQRVRRAALLPNDQLAVANFRYRVKFAEDPDDPPTGIEVTPPPAATPVATDSPVRRPPAADPADHTTTLDTSAVRRAANRSG